MYMFIKKNPNPKNKNVGDCSVRSICFAEGIEWDKAFFELSTMAAIEKDMPSSNEVIEKYYTKLYCENCIILTKENFFCISY